MDESQNDPRRMGRPPLPIEAVRTERVVTFLTAEQKELLHEYAQMSGHSISAAAQELIQRSLANAKQDKRSKIKGSA